MPCSSPDFVWITETEHQAFFQAGYHALYMHADLVKYVQR